jgi:solute:Na+ symporter, SSS family
MVEFVTLGVYLAAMLVLGALFSRMNRNVSDFVRGGAQGTWWMVGTSILMSGVSTFTFTGNASAAFEAGPTMLVIYAANCAAYLIGALFLAAWYRQTRAYTDMDVVRDRFGAPVEQFGAYTSLVLGPIGASIQLWALAVFANAVFGFPLIPTIVGIGLVVTLYSTTGGRWAVMATDFAQGVILLSITLLVMILSLAEIGGVGAFVRHFSDPRFAADFAWVKPSGAFPDDKFTLKWIVVIFFMQFYAQISLTTARRYLAVKDGREARKASLLAFFLMAVGSAIWFIPPMVARFLYGEEVLAAEVADPAASSYAFIAMKLLPAGLGGVMIAAMFSATMSSMDTGLNGQVGIILRNLWPPIRRLLGRGDAGHDRAELIAAKLLTLLLGGVIIGLSVLFALSPGLSLFDSYFVVASVIGIPVAFPLLAGLWVKHLPGWSYFVIFGACLLPSIYSFVDGHFFGNPWTIQDRATWVFGCGIAATLACIPFDRFSSPRSRHRVDEFFQRMRTPVDYAKEIGASRDFDQLRIMGLTTSAMGLALLFLVFFTDGWKGIACVLALVVMVVAVGVWLVHGAHIERRREAAARMSPPAGAGRLE